jgi:AhpD family alkylhydroperoxidase
MDEKILRLIAVGAAMAGHCQSCLETNAKKAEELGATWKDICEAVWVGTAVRHCSANEMDKFAAALNNGELRVPKEKTACGCE